MRNLVSGIVGKSCPLLLLWLCLAGPVTAQPDEEETDVEGEVSPVTDQPGGIQAANESIAENGGDEDGEAEGEEEDEEDSGAGRFIPSEQISQDLGVSFPADI